MSCIFCRIIAGRAPAVVIKEWRSAIAIEPIGPHAPGHFLIIPHVHVADFTSDKTVTGLVAMLAAEIATAPCHLVSSAGEQATQTIGHMHLHVVPRGPNDGLDPRWPWIGQQNGATS